MEWNVRIDFFQFAGVGRKWRWGRTRRRGSVWWLADGEEVVVLECSQYNFFWLAMHLRPFYIENF